MLNPYCQVFFKENFIFLLQHGQISSIFIHKAKFTILKAKITYTSLIKYDIIKPDNLYISKKGNEK